MARILTMGSGSRVDFFGGFFVLSCFGVCNVILVSFGVSSFFNSIHVSISESQLPTSKRHCLVQNTKYYKKICANHHRRHMHASEKRRIVTSHK